MAQTVANLTDVLKEAWTQDRLEKQFDDQTPFLDRIEKMSAEVRNTKIGEKAIVPIHKGRSGGYTSTSSAGGSLNAADEQKVDSAEYTLCYNWFQIALETGALNQSVGGQSSVVVAKDLEIEGAISDMAKQNMRQVATNSDGILAACDTGGASTTVELLVDSATSYGYQALVRGWLYPGLPVDIGTTADTDTIATGSVITAVKEDASDPDITISDSVSTVSGTHFVYIANPNSASAANPEINGLRSMVGSTTSALGGLDPDVAGEEFWKPAKVDSTTTVLSLDLLLDMQRAIHQKTGKAKDLYNATSLKQEAAFYSILQNQVRFSGDAGVGAGNSGAAKWNGLEIHGIPDILDTDWYMLSLSDFVKVTGQGIQKPTWVSDIEGSGGRLRWGQGTTAFQDAVVFPWQLGMRRRNGCAAAIGLTA